MALAPAVFTDSSAKPMVPQLTLAPNESRRVKAAAVVTAHDTSGHLIGTFDARRISDTSNYYSPDDPYTFQLHVSSGTSLNVTSTPTLQIKLALSQR